MEKALRKALPSGSFGLVEPVHSRRMAAIAGKHTRPEKVVRSLLHALGFRFRLHRRDLPGRPDIVLPKYRLALFVHGCFWHGHTCATGRRVPRANSEYWSLKRRRNTERHDRACSDLVATGWRHMTIWECEVAKLQARPELLRSCVLGEGHGLCEVVKSAP